MPAKKKVEEVIEDAVQADETVEAQESMPEVDLADAAASETVIADSVNADDEVATDADDASGEPEVEAKTTKAGKRSAKAMREAEAEDDRQAAKLERAEASDDEPKPVRRSEPNPLNQHGKKFRAAAEKIELGKAYDLKAALELAKVTATTKFDSSVQVHANLGVDPRQADQMIRGTVKLPHGTGKTLVVAVFADGKAAEDAKAAGADIVGTAELIADIEAGKLNFDMLIATPDKMAALGKVARVLGPRGLMPNPKSGTVTPDPSKAVAEAKGGKVEFRIDKQAIVHQVIGRASFSVEQLDANFQALLGAILKAKPTTAKGTYVKALALSTAMGPGIKIDAAAVTAATSAKK